MKHNNNSFYKNKTLRKNDKGEYELVNKKKQANDNFFNETDKKSIKKIKKRLKKK